ncbi:hypothetical protein JCM11957_05970 [Caminibacter profundus]
MKVLIFDYEDIYEFEKKFVDNCDDFFNEVFKSKIDVLIINIDFLECLKEIKKFFNGYIIFISKFIDAYIYKKSLENGDYCYNYDEIYKIPVRLEYLKRKILNIRGSVYKYKNFIINFNTKEVYQNLELVKLTPAEKDLLFFLIKNRNRYVSKDEIIESSEIIESIDSVKVIISSLRKIGFEIINQKNFGYKLKE